MRNMMINIFQANPSRFDRRGANEELQDVVVLSKHNCCVHRQTLQVCFRPELWELKGVCMDKMSQSSYIDKMLY